MVARRQAAPLDVRLLCLGRSRGWGIVEFESPEEVSWRMCISPRNEEGESADLGIQSSAGTEWSGFEWTSIDGS